MCCRCMACFVTRYFRFNLKPCHKKSLEKARKKGGNALLSSRPEEELFERTNNPEEVSCLPSLSWLSWMHSCIA